MELRRYSAGRSERGIRAIPAPAPALVVA